ncbi:translesion error-prone DNA polymerase V autoproteolytic subunit [bacterium]|nr:translesion error-prone DNA polymerase V autoproteolytic subunit [bacterium]
MFTIVCVDGTFMQIKEVHTPSQYEAQGISMMCCAVSAGFPSPADDYVESPLSLDELVTRRPESTFFVRASGESMIGAGIRDRDILVVDRVEEARSGAVVIAMVGGEMLVKRLSKSGERWFLEAANPSYQPIEITEELECVIWGVVTHVLHTFLS